jgi:hypothetical protein
MNAHAAPLLFVLNNSIVTYICISSNKERISAGRPRGQIFSAGRGEIYIFSTASRPVLGRIQHPIQWVPVVATGVKLLVREAEHSPAPSA